MRAEIALFAILIQALVPFVLAAEIDSAQAGELPICSATNQGTDPANSAPVGSHHRSGGVGACPICAALQASTAFASPNIIAVPTPGPALSFVQPGATERAVEPVFAASYRSRAPPLG